MDLRRRSRRSSAARLCANAGCALRDRACTFSFGKKRGRSQLAQRGRPGKLCSGDAQGLPRPVLLRVRVCLPRDAAAASGACGLELSGAFDPGAQPQTAKHKSSRGIEDSSQCASSSEAAQRAAQAVHIIAAAAPGSIFRGCWAPVAVLHSSSEARRRQFRPVP